MDKPILFYDVAVHTNRLTGDNRINVRLYKGVEFKLGLDDFSFAFDGAGDAVKAEFLLSDCDGARRVSARYCLGSVRVGMVRVV